MNNVSYTNKVSAKFENVTLTLGGNKILDEVTASVPPGSCTAIVGPNGAGKTTMLLALLGQLPYKGRISISHGASDSKAIIGYVPQRLYFDRGIPVTVLEFMVMGSQRTPLCFGVKKQFRQKALGLLSSVKADHLYKMKLGTLSGGEMQRVMLALALWQDPDMLVLDEPAAGVDFQCENVFCEILESLRSERSLTQLMVSHDLATVIHHADHVICLNRKVAAEGLPRDVLTNETLTAIFGMHMGLVNSRTLPKVKACCDSCDTGDNKNA